MRKVHINNNTGEVSYCKALQKCPFGDNEHYSTKDEARKAFESKNTVFPHSSKYSSVNANINDFKKMLSKSPFESFENAPLKELTATQLSMTILAMSKKLGFNRDSIESAIALASILHKHQVRSSRGAFRNTPYIEHPLRNSLRLIRLGVKNEDVIIASLLHDTIEDGAEVFVKDFFNIKNNHELENRKILSEYIKLTYGSKVNNLVQAVTNDYIEDSDSMTKVEKHKIYYAHVKKSIEKDPDVLLVKLSDFIDNATGLHNSDIKGREQKTFNQAKKYLPLVKVFMNKADALPDHINKKSIHQSLLKTEDRLQQIIDKYQ